MFLPSAVDFLPGKHIKFSASRRTSAQHSHSFSLLNYVMLPFSDIFKVKVSLPGKHEDIVSPKGCLGIPKERSGLTGGKINK